MVILVQQVYALFRMEPGWMELSKKCPNLLKYIGKELHSFLFVYCALPILLANIVVYR
jgi:hypothetical protein